jgi:signal transduction histidine kinase
VKRKQVARPSHLSERDLTQQIREFSKLLLPRLSRLEGGLESRLKQQGYDKRVRDAIRRVTPLAAARLLTGRKALTVFFDSAQVAGRELAKLNLTPTDVTRALQECDEVIDSVCPNTRFGWAREQLSFCTILALNQAYYEVREAESRAFYDLFHIETQSSNIDFLFRRFVESMAEICGAAAGHVFLLAEDGRNWQLKASTAQAASPKTQVVVPTSSDVRRMLSKPQRVSRPESILDGGWRKKYQCVWSLPLADGGVMQFAFRSERDLLPRELEMLAAAGERCQASARKTRLLEDIASREEQLSRLAIRMLMVEENERRRISRELHDDAGQSLVVIRLQMEMIEQSLPPNTEERERLAEARDITEKTILDLRRLISDLSPAVLEQLGLGAALRQLTNRFRTRYPCRARVHVGDLAPMATNLQLVIYRLAQECLNNIAQHSEASTVNISLGMADRVLRLYVEDNGKGFHVEEALSRKDCFGLAGIRERVAVLGGSVSITSTRKEGQYVGTRKKSGTVVEIQLPIP